MREQILEAYNFRFACKEFDTEKKISKEDIDLIFETGRLSPSSFGLEPWQFLVVQNQELREKILPYTWGAQKSLPTSSHFVLILSRKKDEMRYDSEYLDYMMREVQMLPKEIQEMRTNFIKNFQENEWDVKTERETFDWTSKQTYIPMANMMTTAAHLGIDSCPIEGFYREKLETFLSEEGIVDTKKFGVSVMVAFGYREENQEVFPKTRRKFDEVVKYI